MLIALRDYLKNVQQASLKDIALHFDVPESVAQSMIDHWARKKCVLAVEDELACASHACGGCYSSCAGITKTADVVYRWVDCDLEAHHH